MEMEKKEQSKDQLKNRNPESNDAQQRREQV